MKMREEAKKKNPCDERRRSFFRWLHWLGNTINAPEAQFPKTASEKSKTDAF